MNNTTIAGIRFDLETVRTLGWVGIDTSEYVTADLARVRAGDAVGLLEHCLDGAEDAATAAGWRDYVSTLCAEAGVSLADELTAETLTIEQIQALEIEADRAGDERMAVTCRDALTLLRMRHVGTTEWAAGSEPREVQSCIAAINGARAMD